MKLGDLIERALSSVGVTKERVERFVGGPCGCYERQQKLNELGFWAVRVLRGSSKQPTEEIEEILGAVGEINEVELRNNDRAGTQERPVSEDPREPKGSGLRPTPYFRGQL